MTPQNYYKNLLASDDILYDEQQAFVVEQLQSIYCQLTTREQLSSFLKFKSKKLSVKGLYLWGEVGIGKTFLIDCFYYCLPFKDKLRIHFHQFMKMMQENLTCLQGQIHALEKIAKKLAKSYRVICLDELIVNDIADAMLLAGLFEALYKEKICLLFTSNTAPDNLYLKGIQRDSFLPAIEHIKANSVVTHVSTQRDYRLLHYTTNQFFYTPLDSAAEKNLQAQFELNSQQAPVSRQPIKVLDREITVCKTANGVAWFNFLSICGVPRCQDDYLAIADRFHTIIISNVTAIEPEQNDLARSFINLVDVFYDANRRLIISAEKPADQLYLCGRLLFEYARTRSRLIEMQTLDWQNKCQQKA